MNLKRLQAIWNLSREGGNHYRTNPWLIFLRFHHISKKFHFNPEEACRLGLVDPQLDDDSIGRQFVSKYDLSKVQLQYNPKSHFGLTEDKAVFYAFCKGHGVPHPKVLAVIGPLGGWNSEGAPLHEQNEWERFFREQLPERFIVKPTGGCHGDGVRVVNRHGSDFIDNEKVEWSATGLYENFISGSPDSRWILQEVLVNHPDIVRLTGSSGVSTSRMITWIGPSGDCRLLHAILRVITGHNVIDNISDGKTGNLLCDLDLEKGFATRCRNPVARWGTSKIETHPDTGARFEGFQLPDWPNARELVESIAPKFLPARMLGWDVAFTPDGPTIIETNACWDPPNDQDTMPALIETLRKECGAAF